MSEADLIFLLDAAAVLAIGHAAPGLLRLGLRAFARLAPDDAGEAPAFRALALLAGIVAGASLLVSAAAAGLVLPGAVLLAGGPWDMPAWRFLAEHALPARAAMLGAAAALAGEGGPLQIGLARLAVLLLLLGPVLAPRRWRGRRWLRGLFAYLALLAWTGLLAAAALPFAAWAATRLGFWLILLALVLFQRWRYRGGGAAAH